MRESIRILWFVAAVTGMQVAIKPLIQAPCRVAVERTGCAGVERDAVHILECRSFYHVDLAVWFFGEVKGPARGDFTVRNFC